MTLPVVKEVRRVDPGPAVFYWQRPGKDFGIYRPRISFMLPRKAEGAVVLLFEEAEFRHQKQFYVPLFEKFSDAGELLDRVGELRKTWEIESIYSRLTRVELEFLSFHNTKEKHRHWIRATPPPHANDKGNISYHLGLLRELMRPGRERVFLHEAIPTMLSEIPEFEPDITDMDFPAIAAVVYGVGAVYVHETFEPQPNKRKKWEPFGILETERDPFSVLDSYDPFKNL